MSCEYVITMGYLSDRGFKQGFVAARIARTEIEAIAWLTKDGWVKDPRPYPDDLWAKETMTGAMKHASIEKVPVINI